MGSGTGGIPLDDNARPFSSLDSFALATANPEAFTGGTAHTRGDSAGTKNPYAMFTVTGDVLVRIYGVCTVDLTGTGTLELGVAGNTASLIAQTTGTAIDAGEIWADASPTLNAMIFTDVLGPYIVANGADIIETVGTADITAGQIYYTCLWRPLSPDGSVEAAV